MGKTSSLTFRKQISWGITLAKCFSGWLGIQPKSLTVHSSYIGHPSLWTFCIPVILLFFLQLYFHPSLFFWKPENDFPMEGTGFGKWEKKRTRAPLPFGFWMWLQQRWGHVQLLLRLCGSSTESGKGWLSPLMHRVWVL